MKRVLIIMVSILTLVSCSEKEIDVANLVERNGLFYEVNSENPFTGKINKKNEKGQFILTGHYNDGLKDGEWIEYLDNGQKLSVSHYLKGKLDGLVEKFSQKGQLISKYNYKEGIKDGDFVTYYSNGNKRSKGSYSKDKFVGLLESWYENGKNEFKGKHIEGEYDGLIETYYDSGNVKTSINYKKGVLNGNSKHYNISNILEKDYNYLNGKENGICISYFSNGNKYISTNYKNGIKEGLYEEWYDNGKKYKEITYHNNIIKSEKYWNRDGTNRPALNKGIVGKWRITKDNKNYCSNCDVTHEFYANLDYKYLITAPNSTDQLRLGVYNTIQNNKINIIWNKYNVKYLWDVLYLTNKTMKIKYTQNDGFVRHYTLTKI